jgi:hypothetical protein
MPALVFKLGLILDHVFRRDLLERCEGQLRDLYDEGRRNSALAPVLVTSPDSVDAETSRDAKKCKNSSLKGFRFL